MAFTDDVRARLETHHGGAAFHDTMVAGFATRFGAEFWALWDAHVAAHHGSAPTYIDLGCGPGLMLEAWRARFPSAAVYGVELQPYMLASARTKAAAVGGTVIESDLHALTLPHAAGSVDGMLLSMVIHEMHEPVGLLREARRVLAPHGRLVISDWVRSPLARYLTRWPEAESLGAESPAELRAHHFDHFMEHCKYTADDLTWLVQRLGFAIDASVSRSEGQYLTLVVHPAA